jgi:Flp pilus assembly pilin Flp
MQIIKNFLVEDEGAEVAEYALLVVLLALGIIAAIPALTAALSAAFTDMGDAVKNEAADLERVATAATH